MHTFCVEETEYISDFFLNLCRVSTNVLLLFKADSNYACLGVLTPAVEIGVLRCALAVTALLLGVGHRAPVLAPVRVPVTALRGQGGWDTRRGRADADGAWWLNWR